MNSINFKRRYGESYNRRDVEDFKRRDGEGRVFKYKESRGVGHYQAQCPTFLRKQKKLFCATLSNEETDDCEEDDGCTNAFIVNITETDFVVEDEVEDFKEEIKNNMSFEQMKIE